MQCQVYSRYIATGVTVEMDNFSNFQAFIWTGMGKIEYTIYRVLKTSLKSSTLLDRSQKIEAKGSIAFFDRLSS